LRLNKPLYNPLSLLLLKKTPAPVCALPPDKRRGVKMVCTGGYVATITRKQKRAARSAAGKQAVTHRRRTPRKPLCVRHDTSSDSELPTNAKMQRKKNLLQATIPRWRAKMR
jgi:hypothetical protein